MPEKAVVFEKDTSLCDIKYSDSLSYQANVWEFLNELEKHVTVIKIPDLLCKNNVCPASVNGVFIYKDDGHISHKGSAYIGERIHLYDMIRAAR